MDAPEPITLRYEVTADDYVAFNLFHAHKSRTMRRQLITSTLAGAALFAVVAGMVSLGQSTFWSSLALASVLMIPVWLLFWPRYYKRVLARNVRRVVSEADNPMMLGEHWLTAAADGLRYRTAVHETFLRWPAVREVAVTSEAAYILLGAIQAIIVPRRVFSDNADFERFVQAVEAYRSV